MDAYVLIKRLDDDLPDAVCHNVREASMADVYPMWTILLQVEERRR